MFCRSCGNKLGDGLKYCSTCGDRVSQDDHEKGGAAKMLDDLLETLFWTAAVGLGILVGLTGVLLKFGVAQELLGVIVVTYLTTIFGICFTMSKQIPKLIDAKLRSIETERPFTQPVLTAASAASQMSEFRQPASVTDHTTRTLEKVPHQ